MADEILLWVFRLIQIGVATNGAYLMYLEVKDKQYFPALLLPFPIAVCILVALSV